jgi:serine-type D-Ala-D-Ala carboxypeptidase/endopeptidase (penicillin-binding protein 4)
MQYPSAIFRMFTTENGSRKVAVLCNVLVVFLSLQHFYPNFNMHLRSLLASTALLFLSACVSPIAVQRADHAPIGLPAAVVNMLNSANIPIGAMGAVVIRVSDGATLLSHQSNMPFQPASTLKLLTAIVSLERLGPTYRGRTEFRTNAALADGVLAGDLVLRGLGDPDLDWEAFQAMLQMLRNKGVRVIQGDLVVDRLAFNPPRMDIGVPAFDEAPEFQYNVIPDALLLNTNLLKFNLESGDNAIAISVTPTLDRVAIDSKMTMIDRACDQWEDGWRIPTTHVDDDGSIQIQLTGEFPKNCSISTRLNVIDRVVFADRLFTTLWHNLGGTISGATRDGPMPPGTRLLADHKSRTLAEFVRDINKRSDNPLTRLVYLSLGAMGKEGTTWAHAPDVGTENTSTRSEQEVRAWLKAHGIDDTGLILENGSGLSRKERIRPQQLAAVLRAAAGSDWAPEFMASLPIVGVDGAMKSRLRDSPGAQHARIKTGTLNNTSAVAGYVVNAANEPCIVVAMINHSHPNGPVSPIAKPILDAMIDWASRAGPRRL